METLFDLLREPMTVRSFRDIPVVQEPQERMTWGGSGTRSGEIELHPAPDGSWMWSTSFETPSRGGGYSVGERWGRFAATREDALYYAVEEMRGRLASLSACPVAKQILAWVGKLT